MVPLYPPEPVAGIVLGAALRLAPDGTAVDRGGHGGAFGRLVAEFTVDVPAGDLRDLERVKVWGTRGGGWVGS